MLGPDILTTCGTPGRLLQIGSEYLVGIGGGLCGPFREYTLFRDYSSEELEFLQSLDASVDCGVAVAPLSSALAVSFSIISVAASLALSLAYFLQEHV